MPNLREQQFDSIFANAPIGMAKASLDGTLLEVNSSFGTFMGYSKRDLVNIPINDFTHDEDLRSNINNRELLVVGRKDYFAMEKRYRHRNGHWVSGMLHASIIKNVKGRPDYFIAQVLDLTELKCLEVKLQKTTNQLFQLQAEIEESVYQHLSETSLVKQLHRDIAALDPRSSDFTRRIDGLKRLSEKAIGMNSFPTYLRHHDHNFLKQLNQRYKLLSSHDLKLCLLLRMNLSTKEIA
ncbi:MAG: PAS domain S-box protein, partial [Cyclobacteriaceae bacterium]